MVASRVTGAPALRNVETFLVLAVLVVVPPGTTALLLALPWFFLTLVVAGFGLWRFLPRGARPTEELLLDAGALYLYLFGKRFVTLTYYAAKEE